MNDKALRIQALEKKLKGIMSKSNGPEIFLNKISSPLRTKRNLISGVRKVLQYDQVTGDNPPLYDMDPTAYAYQIPTQGVSPRRHNADENKQILGRTFDQVAWKEFPLSQLRKARYDFLKRIQTQLRNAVILLEDENMISVLNAMVSDAKWDGPSVSVASGSTLQPDDLNEAHGWLDNYNDPAFFITNAYRWAPAKTWGADIYSPARRDSILKTGITGEIWRCGVYKTRVMPDSIIYNTADPEVLGRHMEYMELQPQKVDAPRAGKVELSLVQNVGYLCFNPLAVAKVDFS